MRAQLARKLQPGLPAGRRDCRPGRPLKQEAWPACWELSADLAPVLKCSPACAGRVVPAQGLEVADPTVQGQQGWVLLSAGDACTLRHGLGCAAVGPGQIRCCGCSLKPGVKRQQEARVCAQMVTREAEQRLSRGSPDC